MRRIPHSFCRFYKLCSVHQQKGLHSEKETHIFFIYGSCTCPMRINIAGSPVDRQRVKKSYKRGLSWPPSGPLTPGDALDAGRVDARRLLRPPPLAASHHPACSPPYWLRPRRHAKQQHLAQRPDVIRQSSGHGGRPRLPALGRARAVGRFGVWQWQP